MGARNTRGATFRTRFSPAAVAAIAVVVILVAGGLGLANPIQPVGTGASSSAPSASIQPPSVASARTAGLSGACHADGTSGFAIPDHATTQGPAPSGGTAPGPLFNSQVQPYATLTGPYSYVAGGAALRDQGYGAIQLKWPSADSLIGAYMIWSIMNNTVPPSNGTLNGHDVNGTWSAYATPSPCWNPTYIYTFIADVTSYVKNGNNTLQGFPSSTTDGGNPWGSGAPASGPQDEGVSLVAIYQNGTDIHQVTVYTGALPVSGSGPIAQLNYSRANATAAQTTFIVADGQLPANSAAFNGTLLSSDAFPGSDPKETHTPWTYGNLSDTKTFTNVTVRVGSNNTTAQVSTGDGDCVTWVGQVLSVGVAATKGPYSVEFLEQGLPNGTSWKVTTNGTTRSGTAGPNPTPIKFTLGNGSYSYSIPALPGFLTLPNTGNYRVAGGPVLLRVIFHAFVYPLTFNETGLPGAVDWWVDLTNASQGLAHNYTVYSPMGLSLNLSNGTYHFFTGELGLYLPTPGSGNVTVAGSAVTTTIAFRPPPLYKVTFKEQNLTAGTSWGGLLDTNWGEFDNHTTNSTFSVDLPNATYGQDALYPTAVAGFTVTEYIFFAVPGHAIRVDVNYSAVYAVRLVAHGLPSGTSWTAYLYGNSTDQYGSSTNGTIYYSAENGSYTFDVEPIFAYVATPSDGPLTVVGANVTQTIDFTLAQTYALNFNETGLAPGTNWSVQLLLPNDTTVVKSGVGSTITFEEPNGTYDFTPSSALYVASPPAGYAGISGKSLNESINFTRVFTVTFEETGLPTGTFWEVDLSSYGIEYSYSNVIVFKEPNGTNSFVAETSYTGYEWSPAPATGWANVTGSNVSRTIVYTSAEPTYTITFTQSGLTAGTNWTVECADYTIWSLTSTIEFTEPNGSWYFYVADVGVYSPTPVDGYVVVSGHAASQPIAFGTGSKYEVQFTESGLPNGATWYINVTSGGSFQTTETSDSLALTNATYDYTAQTNALGFSASGGSFTVAGSTVDVLVTFTGPSATKYLVTFTESGLPAGSAWYVNITGQSGLAATVSGTGGTSVSISLANASYTFTAATNNRGWTTSSGGGFAVAGADVQKTVTFTQAVSYLVTFTESGLPNGATWYVNITGQSGLSATVGPSAGSTVTIELVSGSYDYTAATSWKNWTTSSPSSFTVAGAAKSVGVSFGSSSPNPAGSFGSPFVWVGIAIALAILAMLIILLAARRRKKKPPVAADTPANSATTTPGSPPSPPPGAS